MQSIKRQQAERDRFNHCWNRESEEHLQINHELISFSEACWINRADGSQRGSSWTKTRGAESEKKIGVRNNEENWSWSDSRVKWTLWTQFTPRYFNLNA